MAKLLTRKPVRVFRIGNNAVLDFTGQKFKEDEARDRHQLERAERMKSRKEKEKAAQQLRAKAIRYDLELRMKKGIPKSK